MRNWECLLFLFVTLCQSEMWFWLPVLIAFLHTVLGFARDVLVNLVSDNITKNIEEKATTEPTDHEQTTACRTDTDQETDKSPALVVKAPNIKTVQVPLIYEATAEPPPEAKGVGEPHPDIEANAEATHAVTQEMEKETGNCIVHIILEQGGKCTIKVECRSLTIS